MFPKIPDIRFAIPGRRVGYSTSHFLGPKAPIPPLNVIPGSPRDLKLSSRPCPGNQQKGRDLKITFAGRFLRSRICAARFRDDAPFVIPGLPRDLNEKAAIYNPPPFALRFLRSRISLGRFRDDGWGYTLRDSGTTLSLSSRIWTPRLLQY